MIDVIQVYKFEGKFEKPFYTSENRKQFNTLKPEIDSTCGYLDVDTLVLPIAYKNLPEISSAKFLFLQDIYQIYPSSAHENHVLGFKNLNAKIPIEIFKLNKMEPECFDVYLDYAKNATSIGIPKRENHKIGELKLEHPIRYKINGKSDFTFSGRKQRTYYEYDYILEWVGSAKEIKFLAPSQIKRIKRLPLSTCKLIDERKMLR